MRVRLEIGNPETKEWGTPTYLELVPYSEIYAKKYPNVPPYPGIDDSVAIQDYDLDVHGQVKVAVTVIHHIPKNTISIFVKHDGQSFLQVMGQATDAEGVGLSLLFEPPHATVPVNLTWEA